MKSNKKIISISSEPIGMELKNFPTENLWVPAEIQSMLKDKNGFYAFYSAIHVYPSMDCIVSIENINQLDLRKTYSSENEEITVFGQDIFGSQLCVSSETGYFRLDLETGERDKLGENLEELWNSILSDPEVETGYPLAEQWQIENGALPANYRLCPKIPFFMGGEYSTENLMAIHTLERIRLGIDIFHQTKNIPDGQQVVLKVIP